MSDTWRTVTTDDILAALNAAELDAYRSILANEDESDGDILPDMLEAAVMEARGRIAACRSNTLGPDNTLPEVVIAQLAVIVRYRLLTRLDMGSSSERENEYRDATAFFRDVAACRVRIPDPAGASDRGSSWPKPSMTARGRNFNRSQQDGI